MAVFDRKPQRAFVVNTTGAVNGGPTSWKARKNQAICTGLLEFPRKPFANSLLEKNRTQELETAFHNKRGFLLRATDMDSIGELIRQDILMGVIWASVSMVLGSSIWRLSQRLAPDDTLAARALHTTVLSWAVIVGVATVLGIGGVLIPALLLLCVAATALLIWRLNRPPTIAIRADASGLVLWGALIAFGSGYIVTKGLLDFPRDWDSIMYHIPLVDQWLQTQSLYAPKEAYWYYPGNNELVGLWLVAPFSGDFLIGLTNLPAVSVLILGGMELGTSLGLKRTLGLVIGVTLCANYIVFRQLTTQENDVAVAGLFLTGLYYALRFAHSGHPFYLLLGGVAAGLLAGVKYYAARIWCSCSCCCRPWKLACSWSPRSNWLLCCLPVLHVVV